MNRVVVTLLAVLVVAVVGVGVIVWQAAQQADDDRETLQCIEKIQATAAIAVMVPHDQVDAQGRLDAVSVLGDQLDAC